VDGSVSPVAPASRCKEYLRFYTSLHQDYQASFFAFADHLPLNLNEPPRTSRSPTFRFRRNRRENFQPPPRCQRWEEEALFLAEEQVQNSPPAYEVALLSLPKEKDILAADNFSPPRKKRGCSETQMPPPGAVSPSESILGVGGRRRCQLRRQNLFSGV